MDSDLDPQVVRILGQGQVTGQKNILGKVPDPPPTKEVGNTPQRPSYQK